MTNRFDPSFLGAIVCATAFKPKPLTRIEAALVLLAMEGQDVTAADVPDDITANDRHLPGIAVGKLIQAGVLTVVGRMKSPDPKAHGRKLDVLRITSRSLAAEWLRRHDINPPSNRPWQDGELFPVDEMQPCGV